MKEAAVAFLSSPIAPLTIHGTNGNGKSTCLQALTNECLGTGYTALYMSAADMMEFLKAGIGDEDYDVESRLNVLSTIPVLCIDEISGMNFTDWVQEKFGVLIDRRYRLSLGTVLAMDEEPEQILHRRVMSRLQEGTIVVNKDPDMRPLLAGS
jgi:DNA replication protein DnaC